MITPEVVSGLFRKGISVQEGGLEKTGEAVYEYVSTISISALFSSLYNSFGGGVEELSNPLSLISYTIVLLTVYPTPNDNFVLGNISYGLNC